MLAVHPSCCRLASHDAVCYRFHRAFFGVWCLISSSILNILPCLFIHTQTTSVLDDDPPEGCGWDDGWVVWCKAHAGMSYGALWFERIQRAFVHARHCTAQS